MARIGNTEVVDVPVEVKGKEDSWETDSSTSYNHPSFGLIRVSRQSSNSNTPLFGSEISSGSIMSLSISQATVRQDLGKNWYYDKSLVTEVRMTPAQFTELITNPNSNGSPCTIHYRSDMGRVVYKPVATTVAYAESEIESLLKDMKERISSDMKEIRNKLNEKGTMKVSEKQEVLQQVNKLVSDITANLPFYEEQLQRSIAKMKHEAQVEIDTMMSHAITKAGIKAMENPELVRLLLEDKKDA